MSIKRNASGYYDPTAYSALKNVLEEENEMDVKRGDVVYIKKGGITTGSEQFADRTAVIVSNNIGNKNSECVEIVYLTTQKKAYLPTHTEVVARVKSTALCEQIYTVSKDRIKEYIRSCTDAEMRDIDKALAVSIGLNIEPVKVENAPVENVEPAPVVSSIDEDAIKIKAERDIYKKLYEDMLDRMVGKTA